MPVAVWIDGLGHLAIGGFIVEQPRGFGDDRGRVGADKLGCSGGNTFGPFRRVAHHEHRFTEARGFFLHAAGITECQAAARQKRDEFRVRLWLDQTNVFRCGRAVR